MTVRIGKIARLPRIPLAPKMGERVEPVLSEVEGVRGMKLPSLTSTLISSGNRLNQGVIANSFAAASRHFVLPPAKDMLLSLVKGFKTYADRMAYGATLSMFGTGPIGNGRAGSGVFTFFRKIIENILEAIMLKRNKLPEVRIDKHNFEIPINKPEFNKLSRMEIEILQRNLEYGNVINKAFNRSRYYPLPRDLCFPSEKPLITKWASGKRILVEIGVFEGTSALSARKVMAPEGELHLIDPFIVVPDSGLNARYLMSRLNLLRSRNGRVVWYKDYSYNVVRKWSKGIDYLLIDGDHSESACRKDWNDWHNFVSVGGIVLFHDARFGLETTQTWDGWPGPSHVVNELFRGSNKLPNWEIVDEAGSLVIVRRIY